MRRLPLRLVELVALVAALSLGYVVSSHLPLLGEDEPPFLHSVRLNSTAHLSYADVQVVEVRTAKYLAPLFSDPTVTASSVFVVAVVKVTATRQPTDFASVWLIDHEGRKYLPSRRSSCEAIPHSDTGIATYAMVCFDVPAALLDAYHLEVARGNDVNDETRQDDVADLDLEIDPGASATNARTTAAYQVVGDSPTPIQLQTVSIKGVS